MEKYSVTLLTNVGTPNKPKWEWVTSIRTYYVEKSLEDFDLFYIEGKRRDIYLVSIN